MRKQTFITLAYPGHSLTNLRLMLASLREFGGALAGSPVWVLFPGSKGAFSAEELGQFAQLQAEPIAFACEANQLNFPFGAKVGAAAAAEKLAHGQTEFLTWLDSDTIILTEPKEFNLPPAKIFGYRPVHHRLIGLPWDEALDPFWTQINQRCQVPTKNIFPMLTHTGEKIRPYFNAGTFVIRPEHGVLANWQQTFQAAYHEPSFTPFYEQNQRYAIFMHQAILTGVVLSKLEPAALQELSPQINYPLHLHPEIQPSLRARRIDELVTVRYEDLFDAPGWQKEFPISESLAGWIEAHLD